MYQFRECRSSDRACVTHAADAFHVAAITEMSSKLMSAGQYDNVSLYPNVKMSVLDSLLRSVISTSISITRVR